MKAFLLIMIWLGEPSGSPLILGPFETEKLCVDAAGQLYAKWGRDRSKIGGDFLCIPSAYEEK